MNTQKMNGAKQHAPDTTQESVNRAAPVQQLYGAALTAAFTIDRCDAFGGRGRVMAVFQMLSALGAIDVAEYSGADNETVRAMVSEQCAVLRKLSELVSARTILDESYKTADEAMRPIVEGLWRGIGQTTASLPDGRTVFGLRFPLEMVSGFERVTTLVRARWPEGIDPGVRATFDALVKAYQEMAVESGVVETARRHERTRIA